MSQPVAFALILLLLCHLTTVVDAYRRGGGPLYPPQFVEDFSITMIQIEMFEKGSPFDFFDLCSRSGPFNLFTRRWKPEFLKNVTDEGFKQFCEIIKNQSLTKSEMTDQLDRWAKDQGGNIYDDFNKFMEMKKQKQDQMDEKIQTLITNTTSFLSSAKQIMDDMSLTMEETREKIINLAQETNPAVLAITATVTMEASIPAMEHHGKPPRPYPPGHPGSRRAPHQFDHDFDRTGPFPGPFEPFGFRPRGPFEENGPFQKNRPFGENIFDNEWSPYEKEILNVMN